MEIAGIAIIEIALFVLLLLRISYIEHRTRNEKIRVIFE